MKEEEEEGEGWWKILEEDMRKYGIENQEQLEEMMLSKNLRKRLDEVRRQQEKVIGTSEADTLHQYGCDNKFDCFSSGINMH